MTPTEQRVLDAVRAGHHHRARIAKAAGVTVSAVHSHLASLRAAGLVKATGAGRYWSWQAVK